MSDLLFGIGLCSYFGQCVVIALLSYDNVEVESIERENGRFFFIYNMNVTQSNFRIYSNRIIYRILWEFIWIVLKNFHDTYKMVWVPINISKSSNDYNTFTYLGYAYLLGNNDPITTTFNFIEENVHSNTFDSKSTNRQNSNQFSKHSNINHAQYFICGTYIIISLLFIVWKFECPNNANLTSIYPLSLFSLNVPIAFFITLEKKNTKQ